MCDHPADTDLLACIDGELTDAKAIDVEGHLQECDACAKRCRALRYASGDVAGLWPREPIDREARPLARLALISSMREDSIRRAARRTPIVLAMAAALLFLTVRFESSLLGRSLLVERGALPMASLTPGAAEMAGTEDLCVPFARVAPRIPAAMRQQVLRDYGMEHVPEEEYELDYLITPELGGLTDRRNLWPEPYGLQSWNAHAKDALEHLLPRLVCSGRIDVATAQHEIATDWIGAYKKYLASDRPIQLHARLLLSDELRRVQGPGPVLR
jgi:hypothetical protein